MDILDMKDAHSFFGGKISDWTIRESVKKNIIPHFRIGPGRGRILFNRADLEAWVRSEMANSVLPEKPLRVAK